MYSRVFHPGAIVLVKEEKTISEELRNYSEYHLAVSGYRIVGIVQRCTSESAYVTFRMYGVEGTREALWAFAQPKFSTGSKNYSPEQMALPGALVEFGLTFTLPCLISLCEFAFHERIQAIIDPLAFANYNRALELSAVLLDALPKIVVAGTSSEDGQYFSANSSMASECLAYISQINDAVEAEYLADVHALRSLCHLANGNTPAALEEANTAVSKCPTKSVGYIRCAAVLGTFGHLNDAKEMLDSAVASCGGPELLFFGHNEFTEAWMTVEVQRRFGHHLWRSHVENLDVEVAYKATNQQPVLFAMRKFSTGETMLTEKAVAVVKSSESRFPQCELCGRLICDKVRLLRDISSAVPVLHSKFSFAFAAITPFLCKNGCGAVYCSKVCQELAFAQYHSISCSANGELRGLFDYVRSKLLYKGSVSPDAASLICKILAMVLQMYMKSLQGNEGQTNASLDFALDALASKFAMPLPKVPTQVFGAVWRGIADVLPDSPCWNPVPSFLQTHFKTVLHYVNSRMMRVTKCPLNAVVSHCVPEHLKSEWAALCSTYSGKAAALYPVIGTTQQSAFADHVSRSDSQLSLQSNEPSGSCCNVEIVTDVSFDGSEAALRCVQPIRVHEQIVS